MTRSLKFAGMVLSHTLVFGLTAATMAGYVLGTKVRALAADPVYRIGLRLTGLAPEAVKSLPPLEDDLCAAASTLGQPTPEVLRLVFQLRVSDWAKAAGTCASLGWPRCDLT